MWAYLARYPGLAVLHDPRLHHARARQLLASDRAGDYRHELRYSHPDLTPDFAEYAIAGLGGPIYYLWSMIGVVMRTARMVAVYNTRVADELRAAYPDMPIRPIRLGTTALNGEGGTVRARFGISDTAVVFAVFGTITAEKRIGPILRAFADVARGGADVARGTGVAEADVHLLLAGDASGYPPLRSEIAATGVADRVHVAGYVDDEAIGDYLDAADVCLCLRWPTAQETSAAWLNALASGRATVISDLAHLVDIPAIDPRDGRAFPSSAEPLAMRRAEPVAMRIDLLDEEASVRLAMTQLVTDSALRARLARAGHAYWRANHTLTATADDYRAIIREAATRAAPTVPDLPAHFTDDSSGRAREIVARFGISLDDLWPRAAS
jgi:glycosyltransferase involved in cell wall biosynthesis